MIAAVIRHPGLIQLFARAGVDPTRHPLTVFGIAGHDWSASATEAAALAGSPLLAAVALGLGWSGMIAAAAARAAAP